MKNKNCAFSTGNDSYIPRAVVSLLSFRKYNENYDLYILCTSISVENKQLCEYCGIKVVELDLGDVFYKDWEYPKECFYHFKGPEIFLSLGYEYSVYVDGDTYTNRKFEFDTFEIFHVAGASYDTNKELFLEIGEYQKIKENLKIQDDSGFDRRRIQTGVLIYNNKALVEVEYFKKAGYLYDLSIKNHVPRKGDDSLLSLILTIHPEVISKQLSIYHNLIDFQLESMRDQITDDDIILKSVIYHFVAQKPWFLLTDYYSFPHKFFIQKWIEVMINNFTQDDIKRCFPERYKDEILGQDSIKFYWFSVLPPNFGDWVTPYLVNKICRREVKRSIDPQETDENVIISTGSIMRLCGSNTIVWGSGIRDRNQDIKPGKLIRSVRGPLTRARLLEVGGECPPIYGDPALLLSKFYQPKEINKKHLVGIIPHISQYEKVHALYKNEKNVTVIDLRTKNIEGVVDKIVECSKIVSSSLHGIIVANSYDIPVRWIQFDNNIFGDNTKYYDHFASIGRFGETYIDALFYKKIDVDVLAEQIYSYEVKIDLERLLDAGIFHDGEISKFIRYELTK